MSVSARVVQRRRLNGGGQKGGQLFERRSQRVLDFLSRPYPLSIVIVALPVVVGGLKVLVSIHKPFVNFGDAAVFESAVRDSLGGHQLLGPYSRFGWFHLGPAYSYLIAPAYWVFNDSGRTLFVGAFAINSGCAVASVAVIRRRAGEWAARWSALVILALLFFIVASTLSLYNPWNPTVEALPLLLLLVLAAASLAGSTLCLVWAFLVGTFLVQTDIGTVPTVVAVLLVASIFNVWVWRRGTRRRNWRKRHVVAAVGAGFLVLLAWVPPLVQQTTHSPGNMGQIAAFFEHPPSAQRLGGGHTDGQSLRAVAEYATVVPLKATLFPCCPPNEFAGPRSHYVVRLVGLGIGCAVALAVVIVGWRRRHPLAMSLGAVSLLATATAVVSAFRIVGPLYGYLVWWTMPVLLPGWIGAGLLIIDYARTKEDGLLSIRAVRRGGSLLLAISCAVPGFALTWSLLRDPPLGYGDDPARQTAVHLVESSVRARHVDRIRVQLADPSQFGLAASVIVGLQKAGVAVHLEPPANQYYGSPEQLHGPDPLLLIVTGPQDPSPTTSISGASHLGSVEGMDLWLRLLPAQ